MLISLKAFRAQVEVFESAESEIEAKVSQRKGSLERWFKNDFSCAKIHLSIEEIGSKHSALKRRMECMKKHRNETWERIMHKRNVLDCLRALERPEISTLLKSSQKQVSVYSEEHMFALSQVGDIRNILMHRLSEIFPIENNSKFRTIRDIPLPSLPGLRRVEKKEEESVSTALGFLVHRIELTSKIFDFPLRSKIFSASSRSVVKDKFSNPAFRESPLFIKNGDRLKFMNGVELLHDLLVALAQRGNPEPEVSNDLLTLAEMLTSKQEVFCVSQT